MQVNSLIKLYKVTAQLSDESIGEEPLDMRDSKCMTGKQGYLQQPEIVAG